MIGFTDVDRIIGRRVGSVLFTALPSVFEDLEIDEDLPQWAPIYADRDPDDLKRVIESNPLVPYPVVHMPDDVRSGVAAAPFLFPPKYGEPLRLDQYIRAVRRFLFFQLSGTQADYVRLLDYAFQHILSDGSYSDALTFVDGLWRGRSILDAYQWGTLRRQFSTNNIKIAELEADHGRLVDEAAQLVQKERELKRQARSLEEWLHELYCFAPEVWTWFAPLRRASRATGSDELDKMDRVLDEILADVSTSIAAPAYGTTEANPQPFHISHMLGKKRAEVDRSTRVPLPTQGTTEATWTIFSSSYLLRPLVREHGDTDRTIDHLRGILRGRTIIPQVWFDYASATLKRLKPEDVMAYVEDAERYGPMTPCHLLTPADEIALDTADPACSFGRSFSYRWERGISASELLGYSLNVWF
jgi:hypothetical protein